LLSQNIVTSAVVNQNVRKFSMGFGSSASARFNIWNGADGTNLNQHLDSASIIKMLTPGAAGSPTTNAVADLVSFDADGFTLNWTTADATAREILYLAFGSTAVVTPPVVMGPLPSSRIKNLVLLGAGL
jgi:hypothetical protein